MIPRPVSTAPLPSRGALRVLRRLALAGSTVGAIGSACTVATISYEVNRRIRLAEGLVESKRSFKTSCPNYDSTARGAVVAKMMEAAESGEFLGIDSIREKEWGGGMKRTSVNARTLGQEESPQWNSTSETKKKRPGNREEALAWIQALHEPWNLRPSTPRCNAARASKTSADDTRFSNLLIQLQSKPASSDLHECPPEEAPPSLSSYKLQYGAKLSDNAVLAEKLLEQERPIWAAQRFLLAYPKANPELPDSAKQLCVRIYEANIKDDNVHLAHRLFRWMQLAVVVTQPSWETLIDKLVKKQNMELTATVYTAFSTQFEISKGLQGPVLRFLIDSYRLKEAEEMVFKLLKNDHECKQCSVYLRRLWKKSGDVKIIDDQFQKMLLAFQDNQMNLSHTLFNPVLEAYIESGWDEAAERLVEDMRTKYNVAASARTLGLLAYGRALKSDWEGVDRYFEQLQHIGEIPGGSWFTKIFDKVFLEYFLGNSAESIRNFVFRGIEKYNLVPDHILFEHIVRAYIQKGNPKMMMELIELAKERAWPVLMDGDRFADLIRSQYQRSGEIGLWDMFRKYGRFSHTQRVLGLSKDDFRKNRNHDMSRAAEPTTWERKLTLKNVSRRSNSIPNLYERMMHCMHVGSMDKAVELYREARMVGGFVRELEIDLAITATIIQTASLDEAKTLLLQEKSLFAWIDDSSMPSFFQKLLSTNTTCEAETLIMALMNFYNIMECQALPIKHHATVSTCSRLMWLKRSEVAVRVFRAVNKSKYGGAVPFDAVGVKLIAKASSVLGNLAGVRWAILTALKRDSAISKDLSVEIVRSVEHLKMRSPIETFESRLAYRLEVEYLAKLADVLNEKQLLVAQHRESLARLPEHKRPRTDTPSYQFELPEIIDPNGQSLPELLDTWMERVQLEYALTRAPAW